MFKVGSTYTIVIWEADDEGGGESSLHGCKILEANFPLIKFKQDYTNKGKEVILNTGSLAFVRAELGG
jgi:hypothetical protein